ncbi:hypothetical protein CH289_07695 [Rhodococcus sp. RS1C4]|nr:phage minor capsid protein [Rhodococcus sp. RS1C4]OZC55069.1 hypothetical protein CH289_07695 [Rhodococcus sp. RS1C4]
MLDPGQVEGLATGLVDLYSDSEAVLLSKVTAAVAAGKTNNWAETQLAEVQKLKYESMDVVNALASAEQKELGLAIGTAANRGTRAASADLLAAGITTSAAGVIDRHATQALVTETLAKTRGTHQLILRSTDDAYRRVIAEVTGRVLTGSVTREQAAQQALNRLAKQGITGFVDKAGRRWNAATYVEMATRSSVMRAFAAGHEARLRSQGITLVRISAHSNPAPQCAPYEGKILSLDNETGTVVKESEIDGSDVEVKIFATIREAISRGLHHPNCRHVSAAYFPGVKPSKQPQLTPADPEGYRNTQKLRALERTVRAAKRDAATIMDPADRKRALAKVKSAQAATKAFAEAKGLQRRLDRERLQVGDANAVDPGNLGPLNVERPKVTPPTPKPVVDPAVVAAREAAEKAAKAAEMQAAVEEALRQQQLAAAAREAAAARARQTVPRDMSSVDDLARLYMQRDEALKNDNFIRSSRTLEIERLIDATSADEIAKDRAAQVARLEANLQSVAPTAAARAALIERSHEALRMFMEDKDVAVNVPSESVLSKILADGQFRSQRDPNITETGGGGYLPEQRALKENAWFGDHEEPPIYGYMRDRSGKDSGADDYGYIAVVLQAKVKASAVTVAVGDSLDDVNYTFPGDPKKPGDYTANPLEAAEYDTAAEYADYLNGKPAPDSGGSIFTSQGFYGDNHVEAQIHNGVRVGDIDFIHFKGEGPSEALAEQLRNAGIRYTVDEEG